MAVPRSILSRELLPASVAIYTTVAIVAFEGLAVTAALPDLAAELGDVTLLPWVITAFLLASGVATAIAGSFIDALGTAKVFRWATLGFAVASLAAALAPSMPVLVGTRIVQGATGGAVVSVGIAAVALVYPPQLIGRAFAANSNVWGVLGFASPALAAVVLHVGSWRWIFLLMVPICALALIAGWKTLPGPVEARALKVDWPSVLVLVVAFGSLLGALSEFSAWSFALIGVFLIAGVALWRRMASDGTTLLDRRFIGEYPYRDLALVAAVTLVAAMSLSGYLPVYVRGVRGGSVSAAAWSVLWFTIGWTVAANIAGRITDRVSERSVLRIGSLFGIPATALALLAIWVQAPLWAIYGTYFLVGMAVGAVTNSCLQLVRLAVADETAGRATSAHAFTRTVGMSVGAGLGGGLILATVAAAMGDVSSVQSALAGESTQLADEAVTSLARGFALSHLMSLVLMVVAAALMRRLVSGSPLPGERQRIPG